MKFIALLSLALLAGLLTTGVDSHGLTQAVVYQQPLQVVGQQYPGKQVGQYLDTQPEFTQPWANFAQPPGYLPLAFKNIPAYHYQQSQYLRQHQGSLADNQQLVQAIQQNIGFGYVTWSGPVNPITFYAPVQPLYYYRIPPLAPFYPLSAAPKQAIYGQPPLQNKYIH